MVLKFRERIFLGIAEIIRFVKFIEGVESEASK